MDAVTELRQVGPIEPLFPGNWEQALLRRLKSSAQALVLQDYLKASHRRFLELSARAV